MYKRIIQIDPFRLSELEVSANNMGATIRPAKNGDENEYVIEVNDRLYGPVCDLVEEFDIN